MNLEELFTSPDGFDVPASPLQRATCRIIQGLPLGDLRDHPDVIECIGDVSTFEGVRPTEVDLLWPIRCGKTRLAVAIAVCATQTVSVSHLGTGEIPRVSGLSLRLDAAQIWLDQLVGTLLAKPLLKALVLEEPTADAVLLRHPSGRPVEIKIVAGARAGANLVGRWSAGCVVDEHTRMIGEDDGVVNFDDARQAVLGRLLPGAQLISIGSPWAPKGPAYERCQQHWKGAWA